jgi:hypothetical protein
MATPGRWLDSFLQMPERIRLMFDLVGSIKMVGEQTQAAINELRDAITEVANEIEAIDAKLVAGETVDADTANALRPLATRLRNLRPDTPPSEG